MAAAEKRVEELLDRWMASLDLHARYLKLDDAAYARVEPWPRHQRPTAWVVELARKRLLEMRALLTQRTAAKDEGFAEALELMSFLTNLLGSEHIERFIPLATGKARDTSASGTVEQPRLRAGPKPAPQRSAAKAKNPAPVSKPAARAATAVQSRSAVHAPVAAAPPTDATSKQVIADAVRMLEWGREWPALAGLIARMADRPSEPEVWKILRAHRTLILSRARRPG
jgi:hypothetical protein